MTAQRWMKVKADRNVSVWVDGWSDHPCPFPSCCSLWILSRAFLSLMGESEKTRHYPLQSSREKLAAIHNLTCSLETPLLEGGIAYIFAEKPKGDYSDRFGHCRHGHVTGHMMEKADYRLIAKGGKIPKSNDSHALSDIFCLLAVQVPNIMRLPPGDQFVHARHHLSHPYSGRPV